MLLHIEYQLVHDFYELLAFNKSCIHMLLLEYKS
jgi:hypothetical protein